MSDVRIEDRDRVRWIELNRPESKNGLTIEVNQTIIDALGNLGDARVVVLTGAGGSFCSGLDLKTAMREGPQTPAANAERMRTYFHGLIRAICALPVPSIAAIDGAAAGFGCDMALACDLRVLSDRAKIGELFVKRGLIPDGGGTFTLTRLVGLGRALDMMLTGDSVGAEEALRIGLATRLYPTDELVERTWELARSLADGPPIAMARIKQLAYASLEGDLDAALERELEGQLECLGSRDFMEGVMAFLQKRSPKFTGQ